MMQEEANSGRKYQEIAHHLRAELATGRYGHEGRLPSEAQLVRRFGVSRPTAARALRKLVDEGLIERRAGSGTFAKPNPGSGARNSTGLLALLIPDLGNTEIFQLIGGEIASLARVTNYNLVWGGSNQPKLDGDLSLRHAEELCRQFIEHRVSGVFFAPYELVPQKEEANQRMAAMLREAGITVVLLDRDLTPFPCRSDFDLISTDNLAGGYLLAEHLLKLGCRRLHFVARPLSAPTIDARIAGVREALVHAKLPPESDWIHIGELDDKRFISRLISSGRPDAFLCGNDHTAALLLQILARNSIRVPEEVRVVGFDDVKFATLVSPRLTTIQQPCREIAIRAFRAMIERQSDPSLPACHVLLTPRLIVRDSCGAYLPKGKGKAVAHKGDDG
jgi:DNA-binding LacI/PurR family transcriptional regulator